MVRLSGGTPGSPSTEPLPGLRARLPHLPGVEVVALATIVLLASLLAWQGRFIQDDAFISFRYARNLASGQGLVWNAAERVEGYTTFLWVVIMAIPHLFRIDVVGFSQACGILLFAAALVLTWSLAKNLGGGQTSALLAVLFLGTNYTFVRWSASGMETALQATLCLACVLMTVQGIRGRQWTLRRLALLSTLGALAVLTRLDSIVLLAVPFATVGIRLLLTPGAVRNKAMKLAALLGPVSLLVGSWLAWKVPYYGDLLPNTYYVKVAAYTRRRWGVDYLWLFVRQYMILPFLLLGIAGSPRLLQKRDLPRLLLGVTVAAWAGYLVQVGGDFLEFRLLAPVLPYVFTLIAWVCEELVGTQAGKVGLAGLVLLGSVYHALTFLPPAPTGGVESIRELETHLEPDQGWDDVGRALREAFPPPSPVIIAANPVGAIAYYSELDTIDMLGLNDRWIAHNGPIVPVPGHQRRTTLSYLVDRHANLVLGVPWVILRSDAPSDGQFGPDELDVFLGGGVMDVPIPDNSRVVRIPLASGLDVLAWYLTPSPVVDEAIARLGWGSFPVVDPVTAPEPEPRGGCRGAGRWAAALLDGNDTGCSHVSHGPTRAMPHPGAQAGTWPAEVASGGGRPE